MMFDGAKANDDDPDVSMDPANEPVDDTKKPKEERIILFGAKTSIDFMSMCDTPHMDGAVDSEPALFNQIYVIHGEYSKKKTRSKSIFVSNSKIIVKFISTNYRLHYFQFPAKVASFHICQCVLYSKRPSRRHVCVSITCVDM